MRSLLRAGAMALAASSILLGGAVAAEAAPAGAVRVTVSPLIFEPGDYGHTGSIRITIRNVTKEPFSGNISITDPIPSIADSFDGAGGCLTGAYVSNCGLDNVIAPGGTGVVTIGFRSPSKPEPFAQIASGRGSVEVAGATADFPVLFRSTTGSLRHPRPYVQDTTASLTVTAGDATLARQPDGSFSGRVPVTVRNNGDAPHQDLVAALALPAGLGWPSIDPSDVCMGTTDLPTPPGGSAWGCSVVGGQLAEGQTRTFDFVLTAPAGTPVGPLGTGTTLVRLNDGPAVAQTDSANISTFTITVAG